MRPIPRRKIPRPLPDIRFRMRPGALARLTRAVVLSGLAGAVPLSTPEASGQLIGIKTVPIAAGDQFRIFPSAREGMGGVSLALDDATLDSFVNPAKGSRLEGSRIFGSPAFYSVSNENGAGRTLPVTGLFGTSTWFAGFSLAMQQLEAPETFGFFGSSRLSDRSAFNEYLYGMVGWRIPDSPLSLGVNARWASLGAVDGVELLYATASTIEQSGNRLDVRAGLVSDWEDGRQLEMVVVHDRVDMTHEVTHVQGWVDFPTDRPGAPRPRSAVETNLDQTNTWGVHFGYVQPLTKSGWKLGGIVTANRKTHPKIPNYEIQNIPRDPGDSWAYNFGVGLARTTGPATFGIDVVYEPIWSDTWAEAGAPTPTVRGDTIPLGGRTIENDFRFSNLSIAMGIERDIGRSGIQLGLDVRSYRYTLDQFDLVAGTKRNQEEDWMEWTPTWGTKLVFPEFELRYTGRATTGTGRPGIAWLGGIERAVGDAALADILAAPGGPLTLEDARVISHRVSVSFPIR